jgi:hypothetical protein
MDDARVWGSEEGLWTGDADNYRRTIHEECLMVLPSKPFVVTGKQAADAVSGTPRWTKAALTDRRVSRPREGLIIVAYTARAERDGVQPYEAHCTTTYHRLEHDHWQVIQHQQTPAIAAS